MGTGSSLFEQFTLGIEEEFQIVDPNTRELRSHVSEILEEGVHTGLKSYRSEVFTRFPRTGIPDHFDSHSAFQHYVKLLVETGCIDNGKKIYWDVRPHPFFPTLEFRICDIPTRVDDTIAIAALFQALVAKVNKTTRSKSDLSAPSQNADRGE
jgi:gamma-glutamyl:cysteine ligase YbdK (ATP-grasp superfamily)